MAGTTVNRRKRKTPLDVYLNHLVRDPEFEEKRRQFYSELQSFYRRKWNSQLKLPRINGGPLDLYELYRKVTALGGWLKVSNSNRWHEVLDALGLSTETGVGEHAVRVIYMRQLARFEQFQSFGDDNDNDGVTGAGTSRASRGKHYMLTTFSTNDCPYGRAKPDLSEAARTNAGLAVYGAKHTPYDRLVRSLQSGLPNEVDFAVNVCMLLSHPGPKFLRLARVPGMVELLLAHAGIFNNGPGSYRKLYEGWDQKSGRKFLKFWETAVTDEQARAMVLGKEDCFRVCASAKTRELFAGLKPEFDPKDVVTSRIVQVASILRNLSFEAENKPTLAASDTFLRFVYICIHCRWTPLQSMALDTLSNIASEISLSSDDERSSRRLSLIFRILSRCLDSDDKFHIIRALETLGTGLCTKEGNEIVLCEFLNRTVLEKIMALVAVKDIMMCVYVLECLYQISELGDVTCQRISEQHHAVDVLVSLATVEAVSFGPAGLMGMKVVEYGLPQPHTAILPHPSRAPLPLPGGQHNSSSGFAVPVRPVPHHTQPLPATQLQGASRPPSATQGGSLRVGTPNAGMGVTHSPQPRGPQVAVHQDEKLDQLTLSWIRQNCVSDPGGSVSRGELYAKYAEELRRLHGSLAVSANAFSNLLRQVFPSLSVKRTEEGVGRVPLMQVDGIRYAPKSQQLPMSANTSTAQAFRVPSPVVRSSGSPALATGPASASAPGAAATTYPTIQKQLSQPPAPAPGPQQQSPAGILSGKIPATGAVNRVVPTAEEKKSRDLSRPSSRDSSSGIASKHPQLANRLINPIPRSNFRISGSESIGTPEESLSAPASPESLISGLGTEPDSSPGGPGSPKSLKSGLGGELAEISAENCRLEVCEKAQEAKNLIDVGEKHEAKIIRIENVSVLAAEKKEKEKQEKLKSSEKVEFVRPNSELPKMNGSCEEHEGKMGIYSGDVFSNLKPPKSKETGKRE